jgi:hypothetical protein
MSSKKGGTKGKSAKSTKFKEGDDDSVSERSDVESKESDEQIQSKSKGGKKGPSPSNKNKKKNLRASPSPKNKGSKKGKKGDSNSSASDKDDDDDSGSGDDDDDDSEDESEETPKARGGRTNQFSKTQGKDKGKAAAMLGGPTHDKQGVKTNHFRETCMLIQASGVRMAKFSQFVQIKADGGYGGNSGANPIGEKVIIDELKNMTGKDEYGFGFGLEGKTKSSDSKQKSSIAFPKEATDPFLAPKLGGR